MSAALQLPQAGRILMRFSTLKPTRKPSERRSQRRRQIDRPAWTPGLRCDEQRAADEDLSGPRVTLRSPSLGTSERRDGSGLKAPRSGRRAPGGPRRARAHREPHWNVTVLVPSVLVTMLDVNSCEPRCRQ